MVNTSCDSRCIYSLQMDIGKLFSINKSSNPRTSIIIFIILYRCYLSINRNPRPINIIDRVLIISSGDMQTTISQLQSVQIVSINYLKIRDQTKNLSSLIHWNDHALISFLMYDIIFMYALYRTMFNWKCKKNTLEILTVNP